MAEERRLRPGYTIVYPNREKATSKITKVIVVLILLISIVLMLIVTLGGWSKLQGLAAVNFVWCAVYLVIAAYVMFRWSRGLLPIAAALGILLLLIAIIAGTGLSGTSWFDRSHAGFAPAKSIFGGNGLSPDTLGLVTILIAPVQALLIFFAMQGFAQGWNVEVEMPEDEARRRGNKSTGGSSPPEPAPA